MHPRLERLVLPAALIVSTIAVAGSCKSGSSEESSSDGGEPTYCVDIEDMAACESAAACGWDAQTSLCENTCHEILVEADCIALERCDWGVAVDETGGGESCREAFS